MVLIFDLLQEKGSLLVLNIFSFWWQESPFQVEGRHSSMREAKINCPFICFCKPSAARLYTSGPLKLENGTANHVVVTPTAAAAAASFPVPDDEKSCSCSGVDKEDHRGVNVNVNGNHEQSADNVLKSCIKKDLPPGQHVSAKEIEEKRVQWVDHIGKELAEIKEFESSETGDTDNEEESSRCLCVIL